MLVSSHYEVCVLRIYCILNSGKHYKQLHGMDMGSAYCYNAKHQGTSPSYLYLNEQYCAENWHIHVPKVSWTSYHTTCPGTRLTNTDLNKTLTVTPTPTRGNTPTLTLAYLLWQQLYHTSEAALKLSHVHYNFIIHVVHKPIPCNLLNMKWLLGSNLLQEC